MKRAVLVLTNKDDLHASAVIQELERLQRPVYRLNTEDLLRQHRLFLRQDRNGDQFQLRSLEYPREVRLDDLGAVYYRRPEVPLPPDGLVPSAGDFAIDEAQGFLRSFYPFAEHLYWLTSPLVLQRAESKILQIKVAREVGLHVPETLYTNDLQSLSDFVDRFERVALKPIRASSFVDDLRRHRTCYTTFVARSALEGEDVSKTVNFVQEPVEKVYEYRVTVVGDQVFSVRIDSQDSTAMARDDWRREDYEKIPHAREDLHEEVEDGLRAYLGRLGLRFGCFDMIRSPEGEMVFLECNPNGQWLWLETMAGVKIAEAIARELDSAIQ